MPRLRTEKSDVKVEMKMVDWCMEGSAIFLISSSRPLMTNKVLAGLDRGDWRHPFKNVNNLNSCSVS